MWEHGVYTKEEYIKLREREDKFWKDKGSETDIEGIVPEEIAIVKLPLSPEKCGYWNLANLKHGALDNNSVKRNMDDAIVTKWQNHLKSERIAYTWYGDQIKYNKEGEIEWIFSPRYCCTSSQRKQEMKLR
jgi:hypothetical protein